MNYKINKKEEKEPQKNNNLWVIILFFLLILSSGLDGTTDNISNNDILEDQANGTASVILNKDTINVNDHLGEVFKNNFMDSCMEKDETMRSYCLCTFKYLDDNYTNKEIITIDNELNEAGETPEAIYDASLSCLEYLEDVNNDDSVGKFLKDSFMDGCVGEDEIMRSYCLCTFKYLDDNYTNKKIMEISDQYSETNKVADEMYDAISNCLEYLE